MFTKSYRTEAAPAPRRRELQIGESLELTLPRGPTINEMIDMAKERRKGRNGAMVPISYWKKQTAYKGDVQLRLLAQGIHPPAEPWKEWTLTRIQLRVFNYLDKLEAQACLKWTIDALVQLKYALNDNYSRLDITCLPEQTIDRTRDPQVTLTIRRDA